MQIIKPTEMTKLLDILNTIGYLFGTKDIWITDIRLSKRFIYIYNKVDYVIEVANVLFSLSILGSFFTQDNLTEKQATDRLMFSIIFPGNMIMYYISLFYKQEARTILYQLVVVLKQRQNDADLEREMIKKIKVFSMSLIGIICMVAVAYGFRALYQVVTAGGMLISSLYCLMVLIGLS